MWSGPPHMIPHYVIFWGLLLMICGYAFWRGRYEERAAAAACLIATVTTVLVIQPIAERYSNPDPLLIGIDLAMLAVFVAIALKSQRFWPLWAAGFQLTMSMSHLLRTVDSDLIPRAYAAAAVFWSYPILLVILVGTWRTPRYREPRPITA